MKIRTRLFLIVGSLFFVAFVISFVVEDYFTQANLKEAEKNLEKELDQLNEQRRAHFESYIRRQLAKSQAQIDTILAKVALFPSLHDALFLQGGGKTDRAWLDIASLKLTNPWIDFIQNRSRHSDSATIIHDSEAHNAMRYAPLTQEVVVAVVQNKEGLWEGPFIGVEVPLHFGERPPQRKEANFYALFSPESMLEYEPDNASFRSLDVSLDFVNPFIVWVDAPVREHFMRGLMTHIKTAQRQLRQELRQAGSLTAWKKSAALRAREYKADHKWQSTRSVRYAPFLAAQHDLRVNAYFKEIIQRYEQSGLVWGLSALTATGAFGEAAFGPYAPKGVAHIIPGKPAANALLTDEVFARRVAAPKERCELEGKPFCLPGRLSFIEEGKFRFFVNTLFLRDTSLTIGIDSLSFLQNIARAANEEAAFVSGGELVQVVDARGNLLPQLELGKEAIAQMLQRTTGITVLQGKEYYFLHIRPYKRLDVHFFVFKLKSKEFALLDAIHQASQELMWRISWQMRVVGMAALVIVLVILHYLAKSMTSPITRLASATGAVARGKLEDVDLPKRPKRKLSSEVDMLYQSFFEMVQGLREKEKVRGILNKVVSPEIAKEAVAGNIHLGGEEREVTILFADIRHFTNLTEHMPPADVIQLLNSCMTKISSSIDEYGGVIDKYVGDEAMALFGAPVAQEDSVQRAVDAALDMQRALTVWNAERTKKGLAPIAMGFGIHTGTVVAGNMGAENRLNYTVLGANVNLASRLCSRAGEMEIFISKQTFDKLQNKERYHVEEVPGVTLKGFSQTVVIYKIAPASDS